MIKKGEENLMSVDKKINLKPKIIAVIVTYNPDYNEFLISLETTLRQVDSVIIVNNSISKLNISNSRIKIVELGKNYGIALAQNIGMNVAKSDGADFVLQMDQDSILMPNVVNLLFNSYVNLINKGYKVGLVGPIDFDKDSKIYNKARIFRGKKIDKFNYYEVSATFSSGALIPIEAYSVTGGVNNKLFIDAVDTEFCWRLRKHGFRVFINYDAHLAHKLGQGKLKTYLLSLQICAPFRLYYLCRNIIHLTKIKYVPIFWKYACLFKTLAKFIVYPFVFKDWLTRYKYMINGIKDGFFDRWGEFDRPIKRKKPVYDFYYSLMDSYYDYKKNN